MHQPIVTRDTIYTPEQRPTFSPVLEVLENKGAPKGFPQFLISASVPLLKAKIPAAETGNITAITKANPLSTETLGSTTSPSACRFQIISVGSCTKSMSSRFLI